MGKKARLRKEREQAGAEVFGGEAPTLSSYGPVEVTIPRIVFPEEVLEDQITQLRQQLKVLLKLSCMHQQIVPRHHV